MAKADHISTRDNIPACACFNLRAAARALTRAYEKALRPVGLKATQFTILVAISKVDLAVPIGTLAKTLSMDRTTLTRNLRPLEKQGLLEILPEGYRRARGMVLTGKGRKVLERAIPLWREVQTATVNRIGDDRWKAFRQEMTTLVGPV